MLVANAFDLSSGYSDTKQFLVGIECEIEALNLHEHWEIPSTFNVTEDGSLRNNGREFISVPLTPEVLLPEFTKLHKGLVFRNRNEAFTPRTSIHVHVNCKNLQDTHVRNVVLMYALFEEFFFHMVDGSRRNNIHCVPLTETYLPVYYKNTLKYMVSRWSKYTALNLAPLAKQGTIEFRHMHGHGDTALLKDWLTLLENLVTLSGTEQITKDTLNDENIARWFTALFSHIKDYQNLFPLLKSFTRNSVIDVKLGFI